MDIVVVAMTVEEAMAKKVRKTTVRYGHYWSGGGGHNHLL